MFGAAFPKPCKTFENLVVVDRDRDGLLCADEIDLFFAPRDTGVEQIAVQHFEMGCVDGQNDAGTFASLIFVDGGSIGDDELIEFGKFIDHVFVIESDDHLLFFEIDLFNPSDISVADLSCCSCCGSASLCHLDETAVPARKKGRSLGLSSVLQRVIEHFDADDAAFHGRENLDFVDRMKMVLGWESLSQTSCKNDLLDRFGRLRLR